MHDEEGFQMDGDLFFARDGRGEHGRGGGGSDSGTAGGGGGGGIGGVDGAAGGFAFTTAFEPEGPGGSLSFFGDTGEPTRANTAPRQLPRLTRCVAGDTIADDAGEQAARAFAAIGSTAATGADDAGRQGATVQHREGDGGDGASPAGRPEGVASPGGMEVEDEAWPTPAGAPRGEPPTAASPAVAREPALTISGERREVAAALDDARPGGAGEPRRPPGFASAPPASSAAAAQPLVRAEEATRWDAVSCDSNVLAKEIRDWAPRTRASLLELQRAPRPGGAVADLHARSHHPLRS